MTASLGMYDMPHAVAAHDRFWTAIRAELGTGPDCLDRDSDLWADWQSPDLLLSQTCGLPYRTRLFDRVHLVGTPDYGLRGCPPGYYHSFFVRKNGDARSLAQLAHSGTFAFNDPLSQSGWAAPLAHLAALGLTPGNRVQSGAHLNSARAVLAGQADFAAIDAVTYGMWDRAEPRLCAGLDAFVRTDPTPGLPLITARGNDPEPIARAVAHAITTMSPQDRDILLIQRLVQIPEATYRAIPVPPTM